MNKKELSQLYYLKKEIACKQEQLARLEAEAERTTAQLTGMPATSGEKDKVGKMAAEIADIKAVLDCKVQEYYSGMNRLIRYIDSIDDSLTRQIMTLRYVELLPWQQVADRIGGGNTEDSVKQTHSRFLRRN